MTLLHSPRRAACLMALLLLAGCQKGADQEGPVRRVDQSLKAQHTRLDPDAHAPRTELHAAPRESALASGGPESKLQVAPGPETTLFRLSEVPSSRIEVTRTVLRELEARQTPDQAIVVDLPADVLFDFDKADIRPDAEAALDKAAELLKSYPQAPIAVHGHTDSKGSDAYNDALSERRATAVAGRLQAAAGTRHITARGFGEQAPVAPNAHADGSDNPEGRQKNRRVEIIIAPVG